MVATKVDWSCDELWIISSLWIWMVVLETSNFMLKKMLCHY
jgi:hypothetical protein